MSINPNPQQTPNHTNQKPSFSQKIRNILSNKLLLPIATGIAAGIIYLTPSCSTFEEPEEPQQTEQICNYNSQCPTDQICSIVKRCIDEGTCHNDKDCSPEEICKNNLCQGEILIPNTTKILDYVDYSSLQEVSENALVFSAESIYAQNLLPGDVVVTGIGSKTPQGFLKKVISKNQSLSQITIKITSATLEDAIEKGTIKTHLGFSEDYLDKADAIMEDVQIETAQFPLSTGMKINFDNTALYKNLLFLDGSLSISLGADLEVDIDWFKIESIRYTLTGKENLELKIRGEFSQNIHHQIPPIEPVQFPPIPFAIGPVPVIITPNLTLTFGIDAEGELSAETSIHQSIDLEYGLEYHGGKWSPIKSFENKFDSLPFNFTETEAFIEVYAKPKFSLELYDIAGPYGAVKGYLGADVVPLDDPWCRLYAGLDVSAGVHVDVFGKTLADFETQIYDYETDLASCFGASCEPKHYQSCYDANNDGNKDAVWMNSCDSLDEVIEYCNSNNPCEDGQCKEGEKETQICYQGKTWQTISPEGKFNWQKAKTYCNTFEGNANWRLPTIDELRTLIKGCAVTEPGGACNISEFDCHDWDCYQDVISTCMSCQDWGGPGEKGLYHEPGIWSYSDDKADFSHTYWSSTLLSDMPEFAFGVNFSNGAVGWPEKSYLLKTRCIKDDFCD